MHADMDTKMESKKKRQRPKDKVPNGKKLMDDVDQLSRMPGHCPVGKCCDIVFPSNVMMHMLQKHANDSGCTSSEVYDHRPLLLSFDPTSMEYGDNYCVASLMYGGMEGKPATQPGLQNLSLPNSSLINNLHKYDNYLPIMMMACRSTWFAEIKDKQLEQELASKNAGKAGLYVFWLVAPITTRKLYYTLTIYDRQYVSSRSAVRVVRDYTHFQNPSDFLPHDENYMLLRDSELVELMSIGKKSGKKQTDQKPGIPMELIVYQAPLRPKTPRGSHKDLQVALKHAQDLYTRYILPRTKGCVKRGISGRLPLTRKPRSKATGLCPRTFH